MIQGHWEGDLIKRALNRTSVGTLVARKTRLVILGKMDGNGASSGRKAPSWACTPRRTSTTSEGA